MDPRATTRLSTVLQHPSASSGQQYTSTAMQMAPATSRQAGLKNKWWDVAVNVTGSSGVGIQGMTFTTQLGGKGYVQVASMRADDSAVLSNTTLFALDESNNPNGQLSFSGSWTTGTEAGLGMSHLDPGNSSRI
jgi:hypothetical protein